MERTNKNPSFASGFLTCPETMPFYKVHTLFSDHPLEVAQEQDKWDLYFNSIQMGFIDFVLYSGIFVFGLTGALKARSSSMDIFGGFVMAFVTAYGGGTIRDVLIGRYPIGWMNDYFAFTLIFLATCIAFLLKRDIGKFHRIFYFTDAIGLGLFTIGGIEICLKNNINNVYCVTLGVISSTFGGLVADIISNKTPELLKRGELYATASAIGGTIYLLLSEPLPDKNIRMLLVISLIVVIRYISKWKQINLPEI